VVCAAAVALAALGACTSPPTEPTAGEAGKTPAARAADAVPPAPAASAAAPGPSGAATPTPATSSAPAVAAIPTVHLSRFAAGEGPRVAPDGTVHLLDTARTPSQSNVVAWDRRDADAGPREAAVLRCRMRVLEGGDGGAFLLLGTAEFGARGPAPFVRDWTAPNLKGTFAVGIDVHDPKNEEPFGEWGNYQDLPQREVSLHWDGREVVKRVADAEFRGGFADVEIRLTHVCGGAEATVRIGAATVFDRFFVAGLEPYEMRPAVGAATRADATTEFDVADLRFETGAPAAPRRRPVHVEVFDHVRTDGAKSAFRTDIDLPPANWAFERVLLTIEIHDGGRMWDEWDRCGEVSVVLADGTKLGIVPFITSYRTPCRWVVDVTHFRPLLAGRVRLEIEAGTTFYKDRGYLMSAALDFHHGAPAREPFRVVPLWVGTAHHGAPENHFQDFFAPQTVAIDAEASAARLFVTTTGHSQVGEFTPSERTFVVRPDREDAAGEARFVQTIWKTDCYLNPNRPQSGTWKFSRAGWAPGDVVRPAWFELTPVLRPGRTAEFRAETKAYDFSGEKEPPTEAQIREANQVVRAYLILWRDAAGLVVAPTLRVMDVVEGGNAAKAGVQAGDWLESYEGRRLESVDELRAAVKAAEDAGRKSVRAVFFRGSERIEKELPPGRLGVALGAQ
jgi:hypothetical protein